MRVDAAAEGKAQAAAVDLVGIDILLKAHEESPAWR
jgi:hypothetical protein